MSALKPPPPRDAAQALPAGIDWTPVPEALAALRERIQPVAGVERIATASARGRILASPAVAARSHPPAANTAVDGYAFAHASIRGDGGPLRVMQGRAAPGAPLGCAVPAGHAARALTGAALPEGADTVVLQEDVTLGDGEIVFDSGIRRGANTRAEGEDVRQGEVAIAAGRTLGPADLALASAVGLGELEVFEPLKVAIISTGDELAEPGAEASQERIFDANRPMLAALAEEFGHVAVDFGIVPDDRARLRGTLERAAAQADAILTSGGASSGDEDHVSALLNETGSATVWRIAVKPGRPLVLGAWNGTPVFGLPGNPVAAMVCALIFAKPALGVLAGAGWREPQGYDVPAAFSKSKRAGRREFLRARIRGGRAEAFGSEGSGRISGLSWAEGLVELPDGAVDISPGDPVRYIPFGSFR